MEQGWFPSNSQSICFDAKHARDGAAALLGPEGPAAAQELENDEEMNRPFAIIQKSIEEECLASFAGRLSIFRTFRQYMLNMMVMNIMSKRHPEITTQKIVKPIIIVGLNRSGTTFLQNLLAYDPSNRATLFYEMTMPYGPTGAFRPHGLPRDHCVRTDPRAAPAQEVLDTQLGLSEEWTTIHAQKAHLPDEDYVIMEHTARSYSICTAFDVPSYRNWLFANGHKEMKDNYKFHKEFLQHLQWQRPGHRFLLKMPFHLFALDSLFEVYPDAQIIFMHRDPKETIGSWCSLVKTAREQMLDRCDSFDIGKVETKHMSLMMDCALEFRRSHPERESQICDWNYGDLVSDPLKSVESIYKKLDIPFDDATKSAMVQYLFQNRKDRKLLTKHAYSLTEFGVNDADLDVSFKGYYESGLLKKTGGSS
eukprot:GHVU01118590.1.p1 GENE.GHVU01118590.1~~GHVU01118590.1.p1  ORF type:complete len:422 (-),score=75.99 GHVU01118590.1:167-1432(-)